MNIWDILIIALVAAVFIAIVVKLIVDKIKGKPSCSCGCDCSDCNACGGVKKKKKPSADDR